MKFLVVLITGGTGFIGPYLTEKILNETNKQIVLYDYAPNKNKIRDFLEKVVLVQGDILDLEKLEETVKEYDVTRLVHLASIPPPVSEEHPLKGIRINCEGTANIFEMGRIFNLERIVYVSSASVNGPQSLYGQKVLTEEDKHSQSSVMVLVRLLTKI